MKKLLCLVLAALLALSMTACGVTPETDSSVPVPDSSASAEYLSDAALAEAAAEHLGVPNPNRAGCSYVITGPYKMESAEQKVKNIEFYEYGKMVAAASVDPTTGEPQRSISRYDMSRGIPSYQALEKALKGQTAVLVKSNHVVEPKKLTEITTESYTFVPAQYTYVDMDDDGIQEIIVRDKNFIYWLVLRYEKEQVRGYLLPYRSIVALRADGTVKGTEGAGISSIGRITFNGPDSAFVALAELDATKNIYRLNGADASKAKVEAFYAEWHTRTDPMWAVYR